ncbi:hypothetical protein XI06_07320 [Bradyrhizobium sp. CCBAU 11434]|nr:hypothetical protein [Bradyrhizobium sp. CCBAU 11434]
MRGAPEIGKALDLALRGADDELVEHIRSIEDHWIATRASTIAVACWHEKRHFVDFVLTNYGAFRMRQFFTVYLNLPEIIRSAQKTGELLVPIQSYREKLFCNHLGVKSPTDSVLAIAKNIRDRKKMLSDDTHHHSSRFGEIETSGESLLEAIAHHIQTAKAERVLGIKASHAIQKDVPANAIVSQRYTWAYRVLIQSGVINSPGTIGDGLLIDDKPFLPICYGALACRVWGQQQTRTETTSSFNPSERFASLVIGLRDHAEDIQKASVGEAWEIVNRTAKRIFDRTIVEEMRADVELEEKFVTKSMSEDFLKSARTAYRDYHELRVRAFERFVEHPEEILDQQVYSDSIEKGVAPYVIVAASSGEIGDPPPDYSRILGYSDPELGAKREDARWWWAASLKNQNERVPNRKFALRSQEVWMEAASDLAPFAKLVMDGRNIRTMLGPELIAAEQRLRTTFKFRVLVDPRHAYPKITIPSDFWYYLTGKDTHRCDMTYETVVKPEGLVVGPWALRLRPGFYDALRESGYPDTTGIALAFWRDWSPWLFSEEFRERFEQFVLDDTRIVSLEH